MTADDVLDVEAADEKQQDILASTKDDWPTKEDLISGNKPEFAL